MLIREDIRRKNGQLVVVKIECEKGDERGDDDGMRRKWNEREEPDCQDPQKHLNEGMRDCWKKGR